jgi:DNA-binding IclR family transcriptional regulator
MVKNASAMKRLNLKTTNVKLGLLVNNQFEPFCLMTESLHKLNIEVGQTIYISIISN